MNWEILVVPVIVLVVWILTHVIRPPDELPPKDARQEPFDGEPARQPASEVDRFLEEINRLRRKAAEEQGLPPPAPVRPRAPQHTAPKTERVPVLEPARPPRPRPRRGAPAPAQVVPAKAPAPLPPPPPPPDLMPTVVVPPSPADNLRALLRSPDSLRNAVILHEVFGPPRCRRR